MVGRVALKALLLPVLSLALSAGAVWAESPRVSVRTTDGQQVEGTIDADALAVRVGSETREVAWQDLLSFQSAAAPSPHEQRLIDENMPVLDGKNVARAERSAATLRDIGLPVATPLLQSFTDDDGIQPGYRYRLYTRILPGSADRMDRTQGLVRLAEGKLLRGNLASDSLTVVPQSREGEPAGAVEIPREKVRSIGVLRESISREATLDSRQHVTYIEWLDTGIDLTPESKLHIRAEGFVRLSFDEDGWACDADGIHDPLPGKRRLQEGFRWGTILGRVGPEGERWQVGQHLHRDDLPAGRLYLAINENERWQNNIGSFQVQIDVREGFDRGEAR